MRITPDSLNFSKTVVLLNGRIVKTAIAADSDEGWVEIPDLAAMSPLKLSPSEGPTIEAGEEVSPWEELKTKKLFGRIEFKEIS